VSGASETPARLAGLRALGVVAVVRAPDAEAAVATGVALVRGGVRALEVTFTTPGAEEAIAELRGRFAEPVLVGAGTVRTLTQVAAARAAGAQFLVAPGLDDAIVTAMRTTGLPTLAGAFTPTEVTRALALGVDAVKLFPAGVAGIGMLRALREPFPEARIVPTGGVTSDNLGAWLAAGAFAVGAGGSLCPSADIVAGRFDAIEQRARAFADALAAARG
jgi:2-dehydro-3-deoxyphosphogluconate aldolase/(4S)-4-hydroxy-2-oxoglutarate aldolase